MKNFIFIVTLLICLNSMIINAQTEIQLKNETDSVSYFLGIEMYKNITNQVDMDLDLDLLMQGMKDISNENENLPDQNYVRQYINEYFTKKTQEKQQIQEAEAAVKNKAFFEENKAKEGVVTLESGLQYKVISMGDGDKPGINDKVTVHYVGTLIDGNKFDSSIDRGQPATFGLTQVIKGWTEILQLMPVGSKWMVYIPHELGYGARSAGSIPPYSTLIFEIELLDIVKEE